MKNTVFRALETLLVRALLGFFAVLPLDTASALGGALLRFIGPLTRRHQVALKNLALVFPELSEGERKAIANGMWDHFGRMFAEFPFLKGNRLTSRVKAVNGLEQTRAHKQVIYVSGHLGDWELLNSLVYDQGIPIASVYRHVNNLQLDALLKKFRMYHTTQLIRKKGDNAIAMVRVLNQGLNLSILVDQRLTNGMLLPFLGQPAKTNVAAARLSLKLHLPLIPAFVTRTQGAHFTAEILPALSPPLTGNEEEDVKAITLAFNQLLEERIRKQPEQWLWVHDRWK